MASKRNSVLLIASTLVASWLGMQMVHECGHGLGLWFTGGTVEHMALKPWSISQTIPGKNPQPLAVVWAGPLFGVCFPTGVWLISSLFRARFTFLLRFFAGFCLVANGCYLGLGSFGEAGDCGDLLRLGARIEMLWLFGLVTVPCGFLLWNGLGRDFGIGPQARPVQTMTAATVAVMAIVLFTVGSLLF